LQQVWNLCKTGKKINSKIEIFKQTRRNRILISTWSGGTGLCGVGLVNQNLNIKLATPVLQEESKNLSAHTCHTVVKIGHFKFNYGTFVLRVYRKNQQISCN
jgi:hypothetical protein